MIRTKLIALQIVLLCAVFFGHPAAGQCFQPGTTRPMLVEVVLPSDAQLEIGGYLTRSVGSQRVFASPALEEGWNYTYVIKARWQGKEVAKQVTGRPGERVAVQFAAADFQSAVGEAGPKVTLPSRDGFVIMETEGRWWIFRDGSKDLASFKKLGEPEKSVTRVNADPFKVTVRAPDVATLEEYLTSKPGFVTKFDDGRLWVFRKGSKDLESFMKDGEIAKQVIRPGAGPRRMTLKGPDRETIDAYLTAK